MFEDAEPWKMIGISSGPVIGSLHYQPVNLYYLYYLLKTMIDLPS
jgi:hypothetical protein